MNFTRSFSILLAILVILPTAALAQHEDHGNHEPSQNIASFMVIHQITKDFVMATAEMMDEDMYAYRPSVNVRTAGQILAHIANAQFGVCGLAAGEQSPAEGNYEEIATTKEEIYNAVKASFEYCDSVYANMTDEKAAEVKPFLGGERRTDMTVSAILAFNATHTYEHYGNLSTYLRINGLVPPSSQ